MTSDELSAYRGARPRRASSFGRGNRGFLIFPAVVVLMAVTAYLTARSTSPLGLWVFVTVLAGWIITLCLHEFAHAVTALGGGDTSVRGRGYLTLNPLRYTNLGMTFVIPIVILAIGGIPLPGGAVLIEHGRIRSKLWRSAVSAAGPLTNLLAGAALAYAASTVTSPLGYALSFLALLQCISAILNFLPVPGLDGWGIIAPHLSARTLAAVRPIQPWAPLILIAVLWSIPQASQVLWQASYWLFDLFGGDARAASIGASLFHFWR